MAKTYFISYTGQDKECALWIAGVLEEQHQTVRIQAWDIRPGDNFISKMHDYIKECDVCIPVLSQAYLESDFCEAEWTNFYAMAAKRKEKRMIPVRVTNVIPDGLFQALVYIDLYNIHDDKERKLRLLADLEEASRQIPSFPIAYLKPRALFHGSLLPNNLPDRNLYFSGREGQLNELYTHFQSGGAGCKKQTITGLGGVGKTQTATEYAWRFISNYKDAVWLVNAETEITAFSDCLGFAKSVGLLSENMDETKELTLKQLADHLKSWFAVNNSWLFIFDNVEQSEVITPYTSGVQTGHILITTRNRELKQGKSVGTDLFTPDEAAQFMRARLRENADLLDNETALTALIERMNCFPLALEQAGAYMESTHRSSSDYLALLDKRGTLKTLAARQSMPTNYHLATIETLALSFDKLSESARQLLNLCTYMSPDRIPLAFFLRQLERLPNPLQEDFDDDFAQDELVVELLKYSLAKRDGDFLSIHRLVQEIGRDQVNDSGTDWLGICVDVATEDLQGMADYSSREKREQFERIVAHGAAIAGQAENTHFDDEIKKAQTSRLYYLLGKGCTELAWYEQALEWYKRDLAIREIVLGKEHEHTALTYSCVAGVHFRQGNYLMALEWYQRALAIYEKVLGREHPSTAAIYSGIAGVYGNQGDNLKAQEWNQKALAIREKVQGKEHPDTAILYNNIAENYRKQGNHTEALEWYQTALAIHEEVLGKEHPDTANTYHNIAAVYYDQDDYLKAQEWNQKALAIREKVLGMEHPDIANTYNSIAAVYYNQGDDSKALEFYQKALAIYEKVFSEENPDTAIIYNNIAGVYNSQRDYSKAFEWYEKSFRVLLHKLGDSHPNTKTIIRNLKTAYNNANHSEPFETWLERKLGS